MAIVSKLQLPRFRNVGGHCGGFVVAAAVVILRGASLAECLLGQIKHQLLPKYADVYTLPAFNEICNLWQPLIKTLNPPIQSILQLLKFYSISYTVPCCYCLNSVCSQWERSICSHVNNQMVQFVQPLIRDLFFISRNQCNTVIRVNNQVVMYLQKVIGHCKLSLMNSWFKFNNITLSSSATRLHTLWKPCCWG